MTSLMLFAARCLLALCAVAATAVHGTGVEVAEAGARVLGDNATLSEFPWHATVEVSGTPRCGGSILSATMILTAAHCVIDSISAYIKVRVGTTTFNSGGDLYQVSEIYIHQNYRMFTEDFDVALLPLTTEIAMEAGRVATVGFPSNGTLQPVVGDVLSVTGWSAENGTSADTLQVSQMEVVNQTECVNGVGGNLTERMLCVAPLEGGACSGDGGGPAVVGGMQLGIVSVAPYECGTNTVLASLAEYVIWDWVRIIGGL